MKCQKCLFENPVDAKFCIECGDRLEFRCPKCGGVTPYSGKFCMECGFKLTRPEPRTPVYCPAPHSYTPKFLVEKILTTRSSIEGERKLVTVLFADVANFTGISETLDPEEVHQIMDGTFRILMDEIHRVEGTVNQFTGDGVMALFGAPVAHEDHAQRGCHAALGIRNALRDYGKIIKNRCRVDFSLRFGLNSGPVIVGSIGDDLRMDYTAVGDTTNLASRMQSLAEPGTILVSKHTHRLVKDFFEFESRGKLHVKGKGEPQEAFELMKTSKVGSRMGARVAIGLTKFVGRKSAMDGLLGAYAEASSRAGQVVGVMGEAGVGKSRLLLEFRNLLPHDEYTYLEGQCLHYGGAMAYLPILDIMKSYFEITDGDQEFLIKEKMKQKLPQPRGKPQDAISPLQELLSLKADSEEFAQLQPHEKRVRTFDAVRDLFILASEEKPLVLAVEDLHWIDKTSEEFINYLIEFIANSRILLILLYRPEYIHRWGNKSYYSQIGLSQLDTASSSELVRAILEGGEISPELNSLVLRKTGGNPLYIEEFIRALIENGSIEKEDEEYVLDRKAADIHVPDSLQGLIASRIDRLDENIKRTMQVASVIGRDFAFRILQLITGMQEELKSNLLNLQGLEFIYKKSLFPELEYIFKHALTQEVAYCSLLVGRRKELHRKIGEAMESIYGERLTEFGGIIGEHFLRGEAWERAFYHLDKAGDVAARLFAHPEARMHYTRALQVSRRLEPTEANSRRRVDVIIKLTLSSWRANAPEQNLSFLTEAEHLTKGLGGPDAMSNADTLRLARVHFWLGRVLYLRGDMGEAIRYFKQVLPVAQAANDLELIAIPSLAIGQAMEVLGHLPKARTLLEQAVPLLEKTANWAEWIQAMGFLGTALAGMGDCVEGVKTAQRALDRAKELNFVTGISISYINLAFAHLFGGDLPQSITAAQAAIRAAEESGDRIYRYVGYGLWGWAAGRAGQLETAALCMAQSHDAAQELGGQVILADVFTAVRAEIALYGGHLDEALALSEQAVKIAQAIEGVFGEGIALRTWGQALALMSPPEWDKAETQLAESVRLLEFGQNHMEMARSLAVWGTVCRSRGNLSAAAEHWEKAAAQFEGSGVIRELNKIQGMMTDKAV
jgi:class 3 adenylate cyclase/tetratricopeptide (TPR) repeat protein